MLSRIAAAVRAFRQPEQPRDLPLGSVRPLPESVRELARVRPAFPQPRQPSPFPLRDASGRTWAERRAEQEKKA